ncbi:MULTISPECIES: pantetheine-phosphate adenylyltransferase [Streptococcus]|uniref:Phosphopantetheine adenylyltransferase n=2 Tax=Streptococcus ruminantium TaxID=1917441 RepID=A0A2Z5U4U8_9STRE|nr:MULTISPECIES: pantetheine-phosphate adenylyltransferase [Streptococcus]MDQ8759153.1 pantetheine-phosphate adenylyltransferase [Streptococcus ruminantium]MDQ8775632.1 pantetheine-phosphate adenylyltransferase [Streptococcus ruminantium]MDQ8793847.1 pantetheine-phosphate adenylyltransferase [Streptococcus ruminantium]MDQ8795686.1 pantetheine-phosphate adenylyltransferase [Streptococcus ruminantium]MDQ8806364.1 pantetheine-phosphate adenylyltransferase [Streptococcus ruminantium]
MSDKIGMFTGSFDPITKGHVDMIERASGLFDKLYVGIFFNPNKVSLFTGKERLRHLQTVFERSPNIEVFLAGQQLVVDMAHERGVTHIVRGLRNSIDLEYEANFDYFNHQLAPDIETIYLISKPQYRNISSSQIRELIQYKQDISPYVPSFVSEEIKKNEKK